MHAWSFSNWFHSNCHQPPATTCWPFGECTFFPWPPPSLPRDIWATLVSCFTRNLASDKQKKIDGWKGEHFSLTSGRSPRGHWLVSRPVWLSWMELVVCFCFFVYFLIYFFNWNKWFYISYILKSLFNKIYKIYMICYQCSLFPALNKLKVLKYCSNHCCDWVQS